MINTLSNLIFIIILTIYIVVDIKKLKSNKEVIKACGEVNLKQEETNKILEKDITLYKDHIEEHKLMKKKMDTVNRKLTIANKYMHKK